MGMVFSHMTMSLDGFIADPRDRVEDLFEWYETGEVTLPTASRDVTLRVDGDSAGVMRELTESCGALVAGRRLFDITDGWGDTHPVGAPGTRPLRIPHRHHPGETVGHLQAVAAVRVRVAALPPDRAAQLTPGYTHGWPPTHQRNTGRTRDGTTTTGQPPVCRSAN
jgi:hypothetical protein